MTTPFDEDPHRRKPGMFSGFRASFLTGIVVIAPIGKTIWLIWTVIGWIDGWVLPFVPKAYPPDRLIQHLLGLDPLSQINVKGLGVVIFLAFTVFVGWLAKGITGEKDFIFFYICEHVIRPVKHPGFKKGQRPFAEF